MYLFREWIRRLWGTVYGGRRDEDLQEELRAHLDLAADDERRCGIDGGTAVRAARLRFGGGAQAMDALHEQRVMPWLDHAARDLRHAVRSLRRTPVFTTTASLTLAVGLGAATAVFSVVNGVLLKPLPYPAPDALVAVWHRVPGMNVTDDVEISAAQFFTYRDENRTFQEFGLWTPGLATVTGASEAAQVETVTVTHGTLQALGVPPAIGRWFTREDDAPGSPETVLLTHGYWQRRFGDDRSVVGREIEVDGRQRVVIGIMPAGFQFLTRGPELILPFRFNPANLFLGQFNYRALARLRPGVTVAEANADVARMVPLFLNAWPVPPGVSRQQLQNARITPALHPLKEDVVGGVGRMLWIVMATVALVLAIACANAANLVLIRLHARRSELAVRAALGAGRLRIGGALLFENLVLALVGGALGLLLAHAGVRLLVTVAAGSLPRANDITVDGTAAGFSLLAVLVVGLFLGFVSIWRYTGSNAVAARAGDRRSTEGPDAHRTRSLLVIAQVALALVLAIGSGLIVRTFIALRAVEPGFDPDHAQLVRLAPNHIQDPERVLRLLHEIRDRLSGLPGVVEASFANAAPLEPFAGGDILYVEDHAYPEGVIPPVRRYKLIAPGFFSAAGTRLIAGRDFTWTDLYQRRPVAIVSENLTRELWRDPAAAIGKRIRENTANPWREIVGVVADVHDDGMHRPAASIVYWPALLSNFGRSGDTQVARIVTVVIRTERAGSGDLLDEIRRTVWTTDPNVPVAQVRTLRVLYDESMAQTSFALVMLAIAAATALLLAVVGVYGATAYAVAQRRREIAVRVALGAPRGDVIGRFVRHGFVLAMLGVCGGLAAAAVLARFMTSLLFGVEPADTMTYAVATVALLATATVASYVPARRAGSTDPMEVLRAQ